VIRVEQLCSVTGDARPGKGFAKRRPTPPLDLSLASGTIGGTSGHTALE